MSINFSERAINELKCILKKICNDTFDEDDIKNLLLQWRAYFKNQSLIWEFACFISHPEERDKGIFHKELDVRYAKIIYGRAVGGDFNKIFNPNSIDQKLFNTLLLGGIDTIDIEYLYEKTKLNKSQAKEYVIRSYLKKGNLYLLKPQRNYKKLDKIISSILSLINFTASINNEEILTQFEFAFNETIKTLNLEYDSKSIIENNKNKILLCLMCLLHSHNFILYDNNRGECHLNIGKDRDSNWVLYLYAKVFNISWPLMELKEDLQKHIELPKTIQFWETFNLMGFNAIRNDKGELRIMNKNIC